MPRHFRTSQALGALAAALNGATGARARSGGRGAVGGRQAGPAAPVPGSAAPAPERWWSEPLRRCFKFLVAREHGRAQQHLLALDSLGVPLLAAQASGERMEVIDFAVAPIIAAGKEEVVIEAAGVQTSRAGGPRRRCMCRGSVCRWDPPARPPALVFRAGSCDP